MEECAVQECVKTATSKVVPGRRGRRVSWLQVGRQAGRRAGRPAGRQGKGKGNRSRSRSRSRSRLFYGSLLHATVSCCCFESVSSGPRRYSGHGSFLPVATLQHPPCLVFAFLRRRRPSAASATIVYNKCLPQHSAGTFCFPFVLNFHSIFTLIPSPPPLPLYRASTMMRVRGSLL